MTLSQRARPSRRVDFGGWVGGLEDRLEVEAGGVVAAAVGAGDGAEGFAGGDLLYKGAVGPVSVEAVEGTAVGWR